MDATAMAQAAIDSDSTKGNTAVKAAKPKVKKATKSKVKSNKAKVNGAKLKSAKKPSKNGHAAKLNPTKEGKRRRKTLPMLQVRVLDVLAKKSMLSRLEIAQRSGIVDGLVSRAIGPTDPDERPAADKVTGYKRLTSLGYVKARDAALEREGASGELFEITASGREALKKAKKVLGGELPSFAGRKRRRVIKK